MSFEDVRAYAREAIDKLEAEKKTLKAQLVELDRLHARQADMLICDRDNIAFLKPVQRAHVMEALYEREYQNARRSGMRQRLISVEAEIAHWRNRQNSAD